MKPTPNLSCLPLAALFWLLSGCTGLAAEPKVTSQAMPNGRETIRIAPAGTGKPTVIKIDLSKHHEPARRGTPLLRDWEAWRLGAFLCFNSNQFSGKEICRADDPKIYDPPTIDAGGWARAFRQAGMRYAVLTTRHTSGFLLWDSATTTFDIASSGNETDVVRAFVDACRAEGIAPAFYYCMWGGKKWKPTPNARAVILAQLHELATRYGKIPYFWIDMMNWAPQDLPAQQVYDLLKTLQPEAVVIMNQHIQDGHKINYFPTDVMNGELVLPPESGHQPMRTVGGTTYYLPFELCLCFQQRKGGSKHDPLGPSCWFTYGPGKDFEPSRPYEPKVLADRIRQAWRRDAANVLLATAPDHTGTIRDQDVEQLRKLGELLADDLSSDR